MHPAATYILTSEGQISQYFTATAGPRDIRWALVEAGKGQIGSVLDQVALTCLQYDLSTNAYVARGVMRSGGIAIVGGLFAFFGVLWQRERRRWRKDNVYANTGPESVNALAGGVDELFIFVLWVTVTPSCVLGAMVWFAIRYKAGSGGPRGSMPTHNMALEVTWTLIPTAILGVIFFWGTRDYAKMSVPVGDAMEIRVMGQKWFWNFDYPEYGVRLQATPELDAKTGASPWSRRSCRHRSSSSARPMSSTASSSPPSA